MSGNFDVSGLVGGERRGVSAEGTDNWVVGVDWVFGQRLAMWPDCLQMKHSILSVDKYIL